MKLPHRPLFIALAWLMTITALTAQPAAAARSTLPPMEGEVIVQFKPGASVMRAHALAARAEPAAARDVLTQRAAAMGARVGRPLRAGAAVGERTQVLRADGVSTGQLLALLASDPDVESVEPNLRVRRAAAPDDPLYPAVTTTPRDNGLAAQSGPESGQWYLRKPAATLAQGPVSSIDIEAAWARTRGSAGVVVAVLDTGVRPEHPDLAGRLLPGYDFVSNATVANDGQAAAPGSDWDADPSDPGDWVSASDLQADALLPERDRKFIDCAVEDSSWHGTKTGALVGATADNRIGMAGAAPGVSVLPVRVLGKCYGTMADIAAAMRWAAGIAVPGVPANPNPARVLNLSLGGGDTCSTTYLNAVNDVLARGTVIVAAAGNSVGGPVGAPANCPGVIGVLGLRHAGLKVGFSDLGTQISIAAPGGNCINITSGSPCLYPILSASNSGTRGPVASTWTDHFKATVGTSFASPLVAATAGLMLSAQPALTPTQVRQAMQQTARAFPTTGGDNGDGSVVPQCTAPSASVAQLQCYCNTTYCGAGMLDAGAAVAAVAGPVAEIGLLTASPTAGSPVSLTAAGSSVATGSSIAGYTWALNPGSGIVTGFDSASNASTATLTPSAAGSFTVSLTITDSLGASATASRTVTVAAAPAPPVAPAPPPATPAGGGGGALSLPWLLLLTAAVAALFRVSGRSRKA